MRRPFPSPRDFFICIAILLIGQGFSRASAEPAADYQRHCAVCHGKQGDGQGRGGSSLRPPPTDFTAPGLAARLDRAAMIRAVRDGRAGSAMVGYQRLLGEDQISALVNYIRQTFMGVGAAPAAEGRPDGASLYAENCSACHGDRGNTAVWARNGLKPPPRNFTTPEARAELSRQRMILSVTHGRPGTAMMPFQSRLSEAQIAAVVDYIRTEFMASPEPAQAPPPQPAPTAAMDEPMPQGLQGRIARGRDFYMNNCFTCHGRSGRGNGPRAHFNRPPPRDFTSAESRRQFNRPRLFRAIKRGKQGTVMPAWGMVLSDQEIADVAEFVFQRFILGQADGAALEAQPAGTLALGRAIYNYRCYFCHGYSGDARTLAATYLAPPPRAFTTADPQALDRDTMIEAVRHGREGTAMMSFAAKLDDTEIAAVVDFVRATFMAGDGANTRYHTPANGWQDHDRYGDAFPFATGELALDTPWEQLNASQRRGKRLFLGACISCHDRARVNEPGAVWSARPLSYPRNGYSHRRPDAVSAASPYAKHDRAPRLAALTPRQRQGERLFQDNCAFCHAADGTGANWIGRFLQPHPRDLTDARAMADMTRDRLTRVIRDGLPQTTMPAWKHVLDEAQIEAIAEYVSVAFLPANQPAL